MGATVTSLSDVLGVLAVLVFLIAYSALLMGYIRGQSYGYALLNILSALLFILSMASDLRAGPGLIQALWIVISLAGVVRLYLIHGRVVFSSEEDAFLRSKLPRLPRYLARRLLDQGEWIDGVEGAELTQEGTPVEGLVYLERGEAKVRVRGHEVGTCRDDSFIGELTCLDQMPATASVSLTTPSRYFFISSEKLRIEARRASELLYALEDSFARDIRRKLVEANESRGTLAEAAVL